MRHLLLMIMFVMGAASLIDRPDTNHLSTTDSASEFQDDLAKMDDSEIKSRYQTGPDEECDYNIYVQTGDRNWEKRATCLLVEKIGGYYTSAPNQDCHSDFVPAGGHDLFGQLTCTRNKFSKGSTHPTIQAVEAALDQLSQSKFRVEQCQSISTWRTNLINVMYSSDPSSANYPQAQHVLMVLNQKEITDCGGSNYWQNVNQPQGPAPLPNNGFSSGGVTPPAQSKAATVGTW